MWRTKKEREGSARERLTLAAQVWDWKPHSKQRRFFSSGAQVRIAACGRRWGKTEALSIDIASLALAEALAGRPCRQLIVAPTEGQVRLLGNEVRARLGAAFDNPSRWTGGLDWLVREKPALEITVGPLGMDLAAARNDKKARTQGLAVSRMQFRTAGRVGASLRGLWAHRIVVDEASRVPDGVMTEVLMPMLLDVGGDYVLASSPFGRRSAFYRLFAKGMNGAAKARGVSYQSFQCPTMDNSFNDRALLASLRDEFSDAMYAQEVLAEFTDAGGAVFREDDIVGCLQANPLVRAAAGDLLSEPVPGHLYSAGVDWGRRMDYTVCAVLDATAVPARLVHLERRQGASWERQVADVADTLARFQPLRVLVDGNSIGDTLAESLSDAVRAAHRRRGTLDPRIAPIERFVFTPDTKLRLVDKLTLALSRRGLLFPHHPALLAELRGFEYGTSGPSGRARMAAAGAGHDDIVMALALAFFCAPAGLPASPATQVLLGSKRRR